MKIKILFLFLGLAVAITSCKKADELSTITNSNIFNNGGNYLFKKGTVSITTPDTTSLVSTIK